MNDEKLNKIQREIEGSMMISLLNRVYNLDAISNSTYENLKKKFINEYNINL